MARRATSARRARLREAPAIRRAHDSADERAQKPGDDPEAGDQYNRVRPRLKKPRTGAILASPHAGCNVPDPDVPQVFLPSEVVKSVGPRSGAMSTSEKIGTHQKALSLNLDPTIFGSFAEIGAGQEVARWFLRVGGASGTVAKTISAYDKEVSDHLYGIGTRYVSIARLQAMLDTEWVQLLGQLRASRGANTKFFSFVDTVSARNYAGTNDCHGWVGLRFQRVPLGAPNEIILHVNLRDLSNEGQQEAVGILGVNLIDAAFHALGTPEEFLANVFEDLGLQRVEIDCLECSGPIFDEWDGNEIHASLVAGGYAEAVVFPADNQLVPANELLYKRALVMAPGGFDRVSQLHANLVRDTLALLPNEE